MTNCYEGFLDKLSNFTFLKLTAIEWLIIAAVSGIILAIAIPNLARALSGRSAGGYDVVCYSGGIEIVSTHVERHSNVSSYINGVIEIKTESQTIKLTDAQCVITEAER